MRADRKQREWSDGRRGIIQIGALFLVAAIVFFMDEARLAIESGATLVLVAREAGELRPGASVWIAGKQAGRVRRIRFIEDGGPGIPNLEIEAVLSRESSRALRRDAKATLQPSGLLAPYVVDLEPGSAGQPPYDYRDTLEAELAPTIQAVAALGDSLRRVVEELEPVVKRFREDLAAGEGSLSGLSGSREVFRELRSNLSALEDLAAEPGSLARFLADTALAGAFRRSREQLAEFERRAAGRDGARRAREAFGALSANLESLRGHLDAARGTAGRALHDREIQNQARLLRARTDTLRAELAERPFRWLRVRLF